MGKARERESTRSSAKPAGKEAKRHSRFRAHTESQRQGKGMKEKGRLEEGGRGEEWRAEGAEYVSQKNTEKKE